MPRVHRADWVLPIDAPPIRNGWIEVANGRIVALGSDSSPGSGEPQAAGRRRVAILPGLVNAHTHLELSWMKGRVPPGEAMPSWAAKLIRERVSEEGNPSGTVDRRAAIVDAIGEAYTSGTVLVGDVTNSLEAYRPLSESRLSASVFYELLGFRAPDPAGLVETAQQQLMALPQVDRLRSTVVPHAPYSVSPSLFRAIAAAADSRPVSVHLGESPEELRFLRDGSGPWRELLEQIGAWTADWGPPACGPVEYMRSLGLLHDRLVAVHGAQFTDVDLQLLLDAGATVVTCPRSNRWTGAGAPPAGRFYASGVRVAIGTDSLASVEDLNMFSEMAEVRRLAPDAEPGRILRSATLEGAAALGFGSELGSIAPGKRAELLAVEIPAGIEDVEEYLVGGIQPDDVEWLNAD